MTTKNIVRELLWVALVAAVTATATWFIWGAQVLAF